MTRAVFLDRDGVINRPIVCDRRPHPPATLDELDVLPGVDTALARLVAGGFRVVVVTNQPDVARGRQTRDVVEAMHRQLAASLPIDEFRVCYHDDCDHCECRKPQPGLLLQAARDAGIDLSRSIMVGDRWRDVAAGRRAGCRTVFVDWDYDEPLQDVPDVRVRSLVDAVNWILATDAEGTTVRLADLAIRIFADGADLHSIERRAADPLIKGFTTNPTLMRKAGVNDYLAFARAAVACIGSRPISLEVFSDELDEMERQARALAALGSNVYVKIPVTNTQGTPTTDLVHRLSRTGVPVNVTAVFTQAQARTMLAALDRGTPAVISVFAGRIADTGRDPAPLVADVVSLARTNPSVEVLWASPRELLNLFQANDVGCHIITMPDDLIARLPHVGRDLAAFSLETVQMFHDDARRAGYVL